MRATRAEVELAEAATILTPDDPWTAIADRLDLLLTKARGFGLFNAGKLSKS